MTEEKTEKMKRAAQSFQQTLLRHGTFVLLMLIPFQFYFDLHGSLSITVVEVIIMALLGVILLEKKGLKGVISQGDPLSQYVLLFGLSMVFSAFFAPNFTIAAKYSIKWLLFLSAFFILANCGPLLRSRENAFIALTLAGCTSTGIGLVFLLLGPMGFDDFLFSPAGSLFIDSATIRYDETNWFRGGGTGGTFFNRTWYAAFLGAVLPYCIIRTFLIREKRVFWAGAAILLFIGLVFSLSRGGWLAMIGFMFLLVFLFREHYRKVIYLIFAGGMVIMLILALLLPELWSGIVERVETILMLDSKVNRINIWSESLNSLTCNPIVGVGIANIPVGSAHSNYLQILAEQGIVGLALFVTLLIAVFTMLYRRIKSSSDIKEYVFGVGLLGSWTWFIIQGLHATTFYNDKIYALFSCLLGMTAFFVREPSEGDGP